MAKKKELENVLRDVVDVGIFPAITPRWLADRAMECIHAPKHPTELSPVTGGTKFTCRVCDITWTFCDPTPTGSYWQSTSKVKTFIVYSPEYPEHIKAEGYFNIRQSGHYNRKRNCIEGATDAPEVADIIDNRSARDA